MYSRDFAGGGAADDLQAGIDERAITAIFRLVSSFAGQCDQTLAILPGNAGVEQMPRNACIAAQAEHFHPVVAQLQRLDASSLISMTAAFL